jgi:hypothetical protein
MWLVAIIGLNYFKTAFSSYLGSIVFSIQRVLGSTPTIAINP